MKNNADRIAVQDVNLTISELEVWANHDDWVIRFNLRYHPNCTYELKQAIESIDLII